MQEAQEENAALIKQQQLLKELLKQEKQQKIEANKQFSHKKEELEAFQKEWLLANGTFKAQQEQIQKLQHTLASKSSFFEEERKPNQELTILREKNAALSSRIDKMLELIQEKEKKITDLQGLESNKVNEKTLRFQQEYEKQKQLAQGAFLEKAELEQMLNESRHHIEQLERAVEHLGKKQKKKKLICKRSKKSMN